MRSLSLPPLRALGVFGACALSVQDNALQSRFLGALALIEQAEQTYLELGNNGALFRFLAHDSVGDWVDGPEMETLYTSTLARKDSSPRKYYNALRSSSPHNICPFCAQRTVGTLDHYLPKTSHPSLAVTPANLVPSCADCNKVKLAFQPPTAEEQILHPYFDDVTADIWLKAHVTQDDGRPVLEFFPEAPDAWPDVMKIRVATHLRILQLPALYTSHAAAELINIRELLQRLHRTGGADAVRAHCQEEVSTRREAHRNSWQAAFYDALADSNWFCSEGVMTIEESQPEWPEDPTDRIRALATATPTS